MGEGIDLWRATLVQLDDVNVAGREAVINYRDRKGDTTEREIEVKAIFAAMDDPNELHILAHCRLRNEERTFRVDRVASIGWTKWSLSSDPRRWIHENWGVPLPPGQTDEPAEEPRRSVAVWESAPPAREAPGGGFAASSATGCSRGFFGGMGCLIFIILVALAVLGVFMWRATKTCSIDDPRCRREMIRDSLMERDTSPSPTSAPSVPLPERKPLPPR